MNQLLSFLLPTFGLSSAFISELFQNTGDIGDQYFIYIIIAILAVAGIAFIILAKRRNK